MQTIYCLDMTVRSECHEGVEIHEDVSEAPSDVPGDFVLPGEFCPVEALGGVLVERFV